MRIYSSDFREDGSSFGTKTKKHTTLLLSAVSLSVERSNIRRLFTFQTLQLHPSVVFEWRKALRFSPCRLILIWKPVGECFLRRLCCHAPEWSTRFSFCLSAPQVPHQPGRQCWSGEQRGGDASGHRGGGGHGGASEKRNQPTRYRRRERSPDTRPFILENRQSTNQNQACWYAPFSDCIKELCSVSVMSLASMKWSQFTPCWSHLQSFWES